MEVKLLVQSQHNSFEYALDGSVTIGRSDAAMLVIGDEGLSRLHASIHRNADGVWVVDENSTNGCFVNGAMVQAGGVWLRHGDIIALGNHTSITIEIRQPAYAAAPTALPAPQAPAQPQLAANLEYLTRPVGAAAPPTKKSGINWTAPPVLAALAAGAIILLALVTLFIVRSYQSDDTATPAASIPRSTPFIDTPPASPTPSGEEGETIETPPEAEQASDERLRQALLQVVEDRGEPMGHEATVEVPAELRHYSERRRFLAIQTAAAREQRLRIPHDYSELVALILDNQLIELQPLGENYVISGAGGGITDGPFTHFVAANNKSVPIYRTDADLQAALAALPERDERKAFIAAFYRSPRNRQLLHEEYETIARLAGDFGGRSYNLDEPAARAEFKRRLLRFIRPETRTIIEELAQAYRSRFNRPLPVTSLVRTEEYQRELSQRNPNAARTAIPPHTTGFAFDLSYRYMTAAEQSFLMGEIARLEAAGRVEALRENNNTLHIFVFANGRPPAEATIRRSMN